tara:strand:- start:245 stop:391 length:147 start_codon:yes stop_codon:yes gene_type:complete
LDEATENNIQSAGESAKSGTSAAIGSNLMMSLFVKGTIQHLWGLIKGL